MGESDGHGVASVVVRSCFETEDWSLLVTGGRYRVSDDNLPGMEYSSDLKPVRVPVTMSV